MKTKPLIGVLALQGCVDRHRPHIEAAKADFAAVKTAEDFRDIDGLILPGGESTTMLKLIDTFGLEEALAEQLRSKPAWGVCAGSILMADRVTNPAQKSFRVMPVTVERNGYGRQLQSHNATIEGFEVSFIRAPVVTAVNDNVEILAEHDGRPVWLRSGQYMITTFHPELTLSYPSPMHRAFVDLVHKNA